MPDYRALYFKLFRANNKAIQILIKAEQEAEDMVLDDDKDPIDLLHLAPQGDDKNGPDGE